MANELDELSGPVNTNGRDVNVIEKQIPVKVGVGSTIFEVLLWVLGIIPGLIFLIKKIKAQNYFRGLQQKIQANASTIDNLIEQRVVILSNAAQLLDKAITLDLKSHAEIADVMQQNSYLQKEITAARDQYNDTVNQWNHDIFMWPVKMIVAAKAGYTSRIPFTTSFDMKEKARGTFFDNK